MAASIHAALHSATAAAAHLRSLLADLANAVEREGDAAIAQRARALVESSATQAVIAPTRDGRSRDPHNEEGEDRDQPEF